MKKELKLIRLNIETLVDSYNVLLKELGKIKLDNNLDIFNSQAKMMELQALIIDLKIKHAMVKLEGTRFKNGRKYDN